MKNPRSLRGIIAIGTTNTSIHIPILTDTLNEGNETFKLTLSNLSGAVFAGSETKLEQVITIVDDEMPTLAFSSESYSVLESDSSIEISVNLSGPTSSNVSFTYEIIDVTTSTGEDYTVPSDLSGEIQAGSTGDSITIAIRNDSKC